MPQSHRISTLTIWYYKIMNDFTNYDLSVTLLLAFIVYQLASHTTALDIYKDSSKEISKAVGELVDSLGLGILIFAVAVVLFTGKGNVIVTSALMCLFAYVFGQMRGNYRKDHKTKQDERSKTQTIK